MNTFLASILAAVCWSATALAQEPPVIVVPPPVIVAPGSSTAPPDPPPMTMAQLLALIPADAKLRHFGKWEPVGLTMASEALKTNALKKPAEFTARVARVEAHPFNGHTVCVHTEPINVRVNGESLPSLIYAYFDADTMEGVGALRAGETVTISGVLNRAEIQMNNGAPRFFWELLRARLKPKAK